MTQTPIPCSRRDGEAVQTGIHPGTRQELAHDLVRALPRLRRHVHSRFGGSQADDIVQDTLLRALEHAPSFDHQRALWPWLRAIADNASTRRVERESRVVGSGGEHEAVLETAETGGHPAMEASEEARAMLARLRGPERLVIDRHYLQGMSIAEIAAERGVPAGTVKAQLSRGRRRLALLVASIATALGGAFVLGGEGLGLSSRRPAARILESSLVIDRARVSVPRFARIDYTANTDPSTSPRWNVTGAQVLADSVPPPDRPSGR